MPSYKLTYFDLPGKAEAARILFKFGNIPFVDERIKRDDWPKIKSTTPLGQLPVLEIDGKQIPQSTAIFRYLANEVGLAGKNNIENLTIDSIIYTLDDMGKLGQGIWMESDPEKKREKVTKFKESLLFYLQKLEESAKKNGGYIALNRITWADIVFLTSYEGIRNQIQEDFLTPYPSLQQVKTNVLAVESIKNWIKTRPESALKKGYDLKQDL